MVVRPYGVNCLFEKKFERCKWWFARTVLIVYLRRYLRGANGGSPLRFWLFDCGGNWGVRMMGAYKLIYITRFKVFGGVGAFFKKLPRCFGVQGLSQSPALRGAGAFFKSPALRGAWAFFKSPVLISVPEKQKGQDEKRLTRC